MQTITVHRPERTKSRSEPQQMGRWSVDQVAELFDTPFNDLLFRAQTVHRQHFDPNALQLSSLLSIKTGGCPEDCAYCPQSARHAAGKESEPLLPLETVHSPRCAKRAFMSAAAVWSIWEKRGVSAQRSSRNSPIWTPSINAN